jgi:chromosome segregation ATPase
MVLFFLLVLVAGLVLAGLSAKLFTDARKGSAFMGITLAAPGPAVGGIVIGVIVVVCGLIMYLSLSSSVADLNDQLTAKKGELTTCKKDLEGERASVSKLEDEIGKQKEAAASSAKKIGELTEKLDARESTEADASAEVERKRIELESVRKRLDEKREEAEKYAARVGIAENEAEVAKKKVEEARAEIESEKQFRRDFMAVFEELEALENTYAGVALKMYRKVRDLRNKYK